MKMRAITLTRVSTREQAEEGYSLPAQEKLLSDYATSKELVLKKKFSVPESATGKQERKTFNEMVQYLFEHPDIKILLCEKVDRMTRNFSDAVSLDKWLNEDEERQIHFVKQNLIIHKNARSHEKFQWDIYIALARQYSNNLSEETKKGLFEKAEQGWYPGNHKRGYKTFGDIGHKIWGVDDSIPDSRYIEMAFVLYDTGNFTLRTLAKELFGQGWSVNGKAISISELHKLLIDSFYCGEFIWHEKKYQGKHTPLISKELYGSVQERLQRKLKAGKYVKHTYLFGSSLTMCDECGRTVTWETKKGHNYGHCTRHNTNCSQRKYIREEVVETQLVDYLDTLKIENQRLLEWVRKALKESHKDEIDYHDNTVKELDTQYLKVKGRLDVLYDDKVDGLITKEQYETKREQYEQQLNDIVEAKQKHNKANINYLKLGINLFELAQKGREIYQKITDFDEKRELLNFVFSNLKINGEKVVPTPHNGFETIALRAKEGNWLRSRDSNPNFRGQNPACYHYTTPHRRSSKLVEE
ncbi:MAG: Resolvase [Candidatus Woesebacteria bacterium GW2011_GWA1_39_21b]|uniref:Resolvase n=1 Tax=Candidatus Woesebacteria bacterium GW2011_GWA1_39_21b TaxID=1618551 RepID=A0A0G0QSM9_9BACT|nr:MAG: Resolvase [Candidatus Woesebacteria bacterium GW2011_GWA1_39_21b]